MKRLGLHWPMACAALVVAVTLSAGTGMASHAQPAAESGWRAQVRQLAETKFKHPTWGYSHSRRDYDLAHELAEADHVKLDDDVLFAAAYLHDIAAFQPWAKAGVDHQDAGADAAGTILTEAGFPAAKLAAVQAAIRTHMYGRDPAGPEAIYLHDADALDWLGLIGAARQFNLVNPSGGRPDGPAAIAALRMYLKDVPPRIVSPAGRAAAKMRTAELERFLDGLSHETKDFGTL